MVFIMTEKGLFSPGSEQSHSRLNYIPPKAEPAQKAPVTPDVANKPAEGITVGANRAAQKAETTSTTVKSVTGVELKSIRNN